MDDTDRENTDAGYDIFSRLYPLIPMEQQGFKQYQAKNEAETPSPHAL